MVKQVAGSQIITVMSEASLTFKLWKEASLSKELPRRTTVTTMSLRSMCYDKVREGSNLQMQSP